MSSVSPSFRDHMQVIKTKAHARFYVAEEELRRDFINAVEGLLGKYGITPVTEMERKIIRGRPDARIGAVAFELERPIDERGRMRGKVSGSKIEQLQGYLSEIRVKEGKLARGVATNGIEIVLLDEEGNIIDRGGVVEKAWALEVWLTTLALTIVEPRDLIQRLGPESSIGRDLIITLWNSFGGYKDRIPFVKESFEAWRGLYGCAVNLTSEVRKAIKRYASVSFNLRLKAKSGIEEFIYVMETYLSMLMKALVARTLLQRLLVPHTSVRMLLEPDYVEGFFRLEDRVPLAKNVFEADVFTWFVDIAREDRSFARSLGAKLRGMITRLDTLDLSEVPVDLLRRMYQEFFDPALRKALGEFYTSEEMVDEILDAASFSRPMVEQWARSALKSHGGYVLDHGCGSGTFLLRVMERVKDTALTTEEKLGVITRKVVGIDIHPFAVAMARCNYIIAISDLVRSAEGLSVVKIPVYWADSLAMLTKKTKMEPNVEGAIAAVYEASIPVLGIFALPDPGFMNLERLLAVVRRAVDEGWSKDAYMDELKRTFGEEAFLIYKEQVMDLYHKFKERKDKGLNGRWVALLKNVFVVEELRGRCDLVCSNPPWVRIHNITGEIQDNLKSNYAFYKKGEVGWDPKLKKTRVVFGAQFDYSMAFVEAGLRYLKEGGMLAFVITSKVQQALYANVMRRNLMDYKVVRLIDYSLYPKPLFKDAVNYPLILIVQKELHASTPETLIDVINTRNERSSWSIKQEELSLKKGDSDSPWLVAPPKVLQIFRKMQKNLLLGDLFTVRRGIEGWPNKVFIVTQVKPTATPGIVRIETEGRAEERLHTRMETTILRSMVRGEDVDEWTFEVRSRIIWAYDDNTCEPLKELPSEAKRYFNNKEVIKATDREPHWKHLGVSLEKLKSKVAWPDLTKKMEAVFMPDHYYDPILGRGKLIPIKTVYLIPIDEEDLGYALTAVLNSTLVRCFIMSFTERARGGYFRHFSWVVGMVPLPKSISSLVTLRTDPGKEECATFDALVELSRRIHEEAKRGDINPESLEELDRLIAEAYGLTKGELETIKEYFNFIYAGSPQK